MSFPPFFNAVEEHTLGARFSSTLDLWIDVQEARPEVRSFDPSDISKGPRAGTVPIYHLGSRLHGCD